MYLHAAYQGRNGARTPGITNSLANRDSQPASSIETAVWAEAGRARTQRLACVNREKTQWDIASWWPLMMGCSFCGDAGLITVSVKLGELASVPVARLAHPRQGSLTLLRY